MNSALDYLASLRANARATVAIINTGDLRKDAEDTIGAEWINIRGASRFRMMDWTRTETGFILTYSVYRNEWLDFSAAVSRGIEGDVIWYEWQLP